MYNAFLLDELGPNTLAFYKHMYPAFGSAQAMIPKTHWDTCVYWGMQAPLLFNDCLDVGDIRRYSPIARRLLELNTAMQKIFLEWSKLPERKRAGGFVPYSGMPLFLELQGELATRKTAEAVHAAMERNLRRFEVWAEVLASFAAEEGVTATLPSGMVAGKEGSALRSEMQRQCARYVMSPIRSLAVNAAAGA